MTTRRPRNVLLLWSDQQRADTIGAYRNDRIRTPNLDRLAATGTLFEQAYCAQPVCSPSRASILTGLYPHTHGVIGNDVPFRADVPTLADLLRPAGYACGYIGKWHLGKERTPQHGFEECWVSIRDGREGYDDDDPAARSVSSYHAFLVQRGYSPSDKGAHGARFSHDTMVRLPEEVGRPAFEAGEAIRFLEEYRGRPFLLSVNFLEPHTPYWGPFDAMYDADQMQLPRSWYEPMEETVPLRYRRRREEVHWSEMVRQLRTPDEVGWKEVKARYWGNVTLVDKYAGRILRRLDELGLADDTIVVYTSDHGDLMGEHRLLFKGVPYEGAIRIPLIVRAPGVAPRRIGAPVSQLDLVPTLLDLLDQPVPPHLQGASLRPQLAGDTGVPVERDVVVEWNGYDGYPKEYRRPVPLGEPEEVERRLRAVDVRSIRRGPWKLNVHVSGEHELYNLQDDPEELHNAFFDRGNERVVEDLFDRLVAWQRATGDALALPDPSFARSQAQHAARADSSPAPVGHRLSG